MHATSLTDLAESQLATAREASSGRSAATVFGGQEHDLRQTLIALAEGHALGEHEAPGEATLLVLRGRVRLHTVDAVDAADAAEESWEAAAGELVVIPQARHDLTALEDAAVLLTVATDATRATGPVAATGATGATGAV
ncbi:LuxR family transcriptional regulator [Nocardioides sp. dk4132]|uniref:LuxR family transcriptional regulator n=1 Tax=unclassified Nocardioides TaxID=2615069 RepID=UPI0012974800|nr:MULTISPECIES: LuxR family transcriptional regulator [unclassified Nocardioides]MQW74622.1 LuxR family transcriptional regulator [Nocardioides sp. dk4132]QGA06535.1 LuxR family transcriptional regulator [Nocardioides sp. dk884]